MKPLLDSVSPEPALQGDWQASLRLSVASRLGRSTLVANQHSGPLRLQKPLYPEGPQPVHLLLIHPPGGIAGGDRLRNDIEIQQDAQALVTTPGATKWYKANGRSSGQDVRLQVGRGAALEWLPQENIYFDRAEARQRLTLDCAADGRACGWDIAVLGRRASQERFASGSIEQSIELRREGRLWWSERLVLRGGDPLLDSPLGWDGRHVCGLFWALGVTANDALLEACRAIGDPALQLGITCPREGLLLARALGDSAERVRAALCAIWACVRPSLLGRAAAPPRIWAT